ncbi:MAG: TIGR02757 family protein [Bacteroidetes bacterium]|nr:TIGR02757 family protein [Bacteroidota bacterium]
MNITQTKLKHKLDYHYRAFDFSKLSPDPLEFPHRFNNYHDIESSAFIASIFAYGNVVQINNSLNSIFELIGNEPYNFILNYNPKKDAKIFENLKHRFYTGNDIASLFTVLNAVYTNFNSLKYFFLLYYFDKDSNIKNALSSFSKNLTEIASKTGELSDGVKFMFPEPSKGSACKRMNLFLRWMVRKDELDFGLWREIATSKLIVPVDTHIAAICKELKLTKRKIVNWNMAEEITNNLKLFSSNDPVKYDFALCHIGMRKQKF